MILTFLKMLSHLHTPFLSPNESPFERFQMNGLMKYTSGEEYELLKVSS
jgi:hypothetical protein